MSLILCASIRLLKRPERFGELCLLKAQPLNFRLDRCLVIECLNHGVHDMQGRYWNLDVLKGQKLNGGDAHSHSCLIQQTLPNGGSQKYQQRFGRVLTGTRLRKSPYH